MAAATIEFNRFGFDGTDTNKIARRAGFAPQTFYRWFTDKRDVLLAVYRAWEDEERHVLADLDRRDAPASEVADAVIAHHRAYRVFRRGLRRYALEDDKVRKARAESRLRQIERIRSGRRSIGRDEIAVTLLQIERLCDALAEAELADLGLDEAAARATITVLIASLRG